MRAKLTTSRESPLSQHCVICTTCGAKFVGKFQRVMDDYWRHVPNHREGLDFGEPVNEAEALEGLE